MSALRAQKRAEGYRHLALDTEDARFAEELVDIRTFGIAGQPYYSRPTHLVPKPFLNEPTPLLLRRSVVEMLARLNDGLHDPFFAEFFGGEVELYIEDALRPTWLQQRVWDLVLAELKRRGLTEKEALLRRPDLIAKPSADTASPHKTGGGFDCVLRFKRSSPLYVDDAGVWLGFDDGETSERINPDYYEDQAHIVTERDRLAQRNRRAERAIMTGAAFGFETGFTYNPTEVFHKDSGDLLWSMCTGKPAYYGAVEPKE
jgi:D-alanyl-D-alanine dipeptidase